MLTPKQEMFVREYLIDLNATQAAIKAGYSERTADQQGSRLLTNVKVARAVQAAQAERAERVQISADEVLKEIAKLAFSDVRGLFDAEGRLLPVHELSDSAAACISSIEVVTSRVPGGEPTDVEHTAKIKLWDKRASLELLGKHLKLFTERIEVSGLEQVAQAMAAAIKRKRG